MWPSFIGLTALDAVIGASWPPAGDGWDVIGAGLFAGFANLAAIVALSVPLKHLIRRRRPDLPKMVAGDYAGTTMMGAITVALLVAGLIHQSAVQSDERAMADAIARAQAYIGDRAPAQFRGNVRYVNTYVIQSGSLYRICVPSIVGDQLYCVVVHERLPFAQSVRPSGSEPNSVLGAGSN